MENCIFCKIAKGDISAYKVYEDENTLAFLDISPIAHYHTVVIPKAHYVNVLDIPNEALLQVMSAAKQVVNLYRDKLGLKNLQIIHNAGPEGGQEVFHLHVHIIPRSAEDGIQMSWKTHPEWQEKFSEMIQELEA